MQLPCFTALTRMAAIAAIGMLADAHASLLDEWVLTSMTVDGQVVDGVTGTRTYDGQPCSPFACPDFDGQFNSSARYLTNRGSVTGAYRVMGETLEVGTGLTNIFWTDGSFESIGQPVLGLTSPSENFTLNGDLLEIRAGDAVMTYQRASTLSPAPLASVLPGSRSAVTGVAVTAFASIVNSGQVTAEDCSVGLPVAPSIPATLMYQTTDPGTNEPVGTPDTPVDIAATTTQTFFFALTATATFPPTDLPLVFDCVNSNPAPVNVGLNTLLVSASANAVADVIALGGTAEGGGVLTLDTGGAFVVASLNVGASDNITVTADTGGATPPLAMSICETDPVDSTCLSPAIDPLIGVATTIASGATPTFAVFATATGEIPFDPANTRVFVRFSDASGVVRGATSVAIRTP